MVFKRILTPPTTSFFLFGPRGIGKTTWLHEHFTDAYFVDLLDTKLFLKLSKEPSLLGAMVQSQPPGTWICIDEVQKVPLLLDEVQRLMHKKMWSFVLTGSSARKLKRAGSNLLAGRAITKNMESLSIHEIGSAEKFDILLNFGTLPLVVQNPEIAKEILDTYVGTYIKEEIREEGLVRMIEPFLRFIEIAGLLNGQKINYQNIAREAGVPASNVQNYYSILVDTLVGHLLPAYRPSAKVREVAHAKFYWFDPGVARTAAGLIHDPIDAVSIGFALETLIFHELRIYNHTFQKYRNIFYYESGGGVEIDFIIETEKKTSSSKQSVVCIEVKNSKNWKREWENGIRGLQASSQVNVKKSIGLYRGEHTLTFENFVVFPVATFIEKLYLGEIY